MEGGKRARPEAEKEAWEKENDEQKARILELEQKLEATEAAKSDAESKIHELERRVDAAEASMNDAESKVSAARALEREFGQKLDRIVQLEEELTQKEVKIIAKEDELASATASFKTVLALKNQKIKDLEKALADSPAAIEKGADAAPSAIQRKASMDPIVIRTMFKGISKMEGRMNSERVISNNCEWHFSIKKNRNKDHLTFCVQTSVTDEKRGYKPLAFVKFRLLSHANCDILSEHCFSKVQNFSESDWGKQSFISLEKLFDEKERFVFDDSIIAEVWIKEIGRAAE